MVLSVSYVLSRLRFKGRKLLMNTCLVLGMFPGFVTMIVLYKVLSGMGLTGANSVPGLILVYCASSGMGYYVSKGFFDTIPKSLDEAARVDGASRFQVFYKVIMPLSKPIVIYTVLTAFMAPWGDFMFAKYISHNTEVGTTAVQPSGTGKASCSGTSQPVRRTACASSRVQGRMFLQPVSRAAVMLRGSAKTSRVWPERSTRPLSSAIISGQRR